MPWASPIGGLMARDTPTRPRTAAAYRPGRIVFGAMAVVMAVGCADPSESLSSNDRILICRATIATVMGRPMEIIGG